MNTIHISSSRYILRRFRRLFILVGALFLLAGASPLHAEEIFARLAEMAHVESTYVSGRAASGTPKGSINLKGDYLRQGFKSLWNYECYSQESVREARRILDAYIKAHPEAELVIRTKNGGGEYSVYQSYDKADHLKQLIIWSSDAPNVAQVTVIIPNESATSYSYTIPSSNSSTSSISTTSSSRSSASTRTKTRTPSSTKREPTAKRRDDFISAARKMPGEYSTFIKINNNKYQDPLGGNSYALRKVNCKIPFAVELREGTPKIVIEGRDAATVADCTKVSFEGPALNIEWIPRGKEASGCKATVTVYLEEFSAISSFNTCDIKARRLDTSSLTLQTFGAGGITVDGIDCTSLKVNSMGTGNIRLGNVDATTVTIFNKTANVTVSNLDATRLEVQSHGTGAVNVPRLDSTALSVTAFGGGAVRIAGETGNASIVADPRSTVDISRLSARTITTKTHIPSGYSEDN